MLWTFVPVPDVVKHHDTLPFLSFYLAFMVTFAMQER